MIKIAHISDSHSYAGEATIKFVQECGFEDYKICTYSSAAEVYHALTSGICDYAVFEYRNSFWGKNPQTEEALSGNILELISLLNLRVNYCLFISKGCSMDAIDTIIGAESTITESKDNLTSMFPSANLIIGDEVETAHNLCHYSLPHSYAVICREIIGDAFGLQMIAHNLQDVPDCFAEFRLYKAPNFKTAYFSADAEAEYSDKFQEC